MSSAGSGTNWYIGTRSRNRVVSSAFFLASAAVLLAIWGVLVLSGVPKAKSTLEHVAELIPFLFAESEHPWFFVLIAVLPLLFLALAAWHWHERRSLRHVPVWVWVLTGSALGLSVFVHWPVLLASCTAAYYAYRSNSDA